MPYPDPKRRDVRSWLFLGTLFVLGGLLGVLQYRWIGEVSRADRDRLRGSLEASLRRLSQDFNSEITQVCAALTPSGMAPGDEPDEEDYARLYRQWKQTTHHGAIFHRIGLVLRQDDAIRLRLLDLNGGTFSDGAWPAEWSEVRERLETRQGRGAPAPTAGADLLFELPRFSPPPAGPPPDGPRRRFGRRESGRLLVELDPVYVRDVMLPELVRRHLGTAGSLEYQVEVVTRRGTPAVIYRSDPTQKERLAGSADASANLCDLQFDQIMRRWAPQATAGRGPGPGGGAPSEAGRWQILVRHRAGSLDVVVGRARWRNLAVAAGILLLMAAALAAFVRYTRRAQELAEMEMSFVAGVSHELRTPLTVIHTAAYNLRGKLAANPAQVERYGALIQQESGRLTSLVEQVLRFANAKAGRVIADPRPVSVASMIEDSIESSKSVVADAHAVVETKIEPDLPPVLGDGVALRHALQNLIGNAAKYGTEGSPWIGVSARTLRGDGEAVVEIRVTDRGPGIPTDEQARVFDPFFRGRRAVHGQIHGTGLGLNLARQIVEAHKGSIAVKSEPMQGTEFTIRIPTAPTDRQDELSNPAD